MPAKYRIVLWNPPTILSPYCVRQMTGGYESTNALLVKNSILWDHPKAVGRSYGWFSNGGVKKMMRFSRKEGCFRELTIALHRGQFVALSADRSRPGVGQLSSCEKLTAN
jgi:hypothetical protein